MAWERRGDNLYYYQAEREDGRVQKRYVGTGEIAELIAHADATLRRTRLEQRQSARAELEDARYLASAADELVSAGYHRHKGQWRRRRDA